MTGVMLDAAGLRLRPTRPQDLAFVRGAEAAPENRDFVEQWSEAEHRACLEGDDCCHLTIEEADGTPVGYVILEGLTDPGGSVLLRRIVVSRKGAGIGRRAMQAIERFCFEDLRALRLWLEVYDDNPVACGLYRRDGFRVEGTGRSEDGRHGVLRMVLKRRDYCRRRAARPPG
jgi:RimJ/RimL family protein N-acetyltransferase